MFRVFYDNNGDIIYITDANEELPTESLYSYIDVENLPARDMYRQGLAVQNGELVVIDYELTPEQEKDIERNEILIEINKNQQYLNKTDYVALKLSEIIARVLSNGNSNELSIFTAKYQDILEQRQVARNNIDTLRQEIEKLK